MSTNGQASGPQKAFFSYSREDSRFVQKLAGDLRQQGTDIWLDQLSITPGKHWDSAIEEALERASRIILVLSPSAVASKNVMDEVSFALEAGKDIIPVLYRPCKIPFRLRRVQHIDFTTNYDDALAQLIRTLRQDTPLPPNPADAADSRKSQSGIGAISKRYLLLGALILAALLAAAAWLMWRGGSGKTAAKNQPSATPSAGSPSMLREPLPDDLSAVNVQANSLSFTLSDNFIKWYSSRATIAPKMLVDQVGRIHSPNTDGDLHFAGRTEQVFLPVVAEIMNAKLVPSAVAQVTASRGSNTPLQIAGAWRLWPERSGHEPQEQGMNTAEATTTNPEHVFEVHPVTYVGSESILETLKEVQGFEPKEAAAAFRNYEQMPCSIVHDSKSGRTTVTTKRTGYNYVDFTMEIEAEPQSLSDGKTVRAKVRDSSGELIVADKVMVFVRGSAPEQRLLSAKVGDRLKVMGIPRISLSRLWESIGQGGSSCRQAYEMIIAAVY